MKESKHHSAAIAVVASIVLFAAVTSVGLATDADTVGTAAHPAKYAAVQVKNKCKRITKKINGKRRTVRVCAKKGAAASQAVVAKRLAKRFAAAGSPDSRYAALVGIMRALNIGVYLPSGKALVRGAERTSGDFYLYRAELRILAGSAARAGSLTELADTITAMAGGPRVTADQLRQAIVTGTARARAHPKNPRSLGPLLVRELGLRHHPAYDTARDIPVDASFDSLQTFLLTAEAFAPNLYPHRSRNTAGGRDETPCKAASADPDIQRVLKLGQWIGGKLPIPDEWDLPLEQEHAEILMKVLRFSKVEADSITKGHYGPAGHSTLPGPSTKLAFAVRVDADYGADKKTADQIVDELNACANLLDLDLVLPKQGPVDGATIRWGGTGYEKLPKHGKVGGGVKTDQAGEGTLRVDLKTEAIPGWPPVAKTDSGTLTASLDWLSRFGNKLGALLDSVHVDIPFEWTVGFHKARGFKFAGMLRDNFFNPFGKPSGRVDVDFALCGDDPFGHSWLGTMQWVSEGDTESAKADWSFFEGVTSFPLAVEQPGWPAGYPLKYAIGKVVASNPPVAHFELTDTTGKVNATPTLPVVEDTRCPDNS